jgi:hypothetical protein
MGLRLSILAALLLVTAQLASAETTKHTRTTTTTTVESDDEAFAPPADAIPAPRNAKPPGAGAFIDATLSQTFGSTATSGTAGCKTEALSKSVVKDLKRECAAWVKEQKADIGKNYLGNTCEDTCDDCGMSLLRCKVTGTVRYRKSTSEPDVDVE